jgi:hypothetical protein
MLLWLRTAGPAAPPRPRPPRALRRPVGPRSRVAPRRRRRPVLPRLPSPVLSPPRRQALRRRGQPRFPPVRPRGRALPMPRPRPRPAVRPRRARRLRRRARRARVAVPQRLRPPPLQPTWPRPRLVRLAPLAEWYMTSPAGAPRVPPVQSRQQPAPRPALPEKRRVRPAAWATPWAASPDPPEVPPRASPVPLVTPWTGSPTARQPAVWPVPLVMPSTEWPDRPETGSEASRVLVVGPCQVPRAALTRCSTVGPARRQR